MAQAAARGVKIVSVDQRITAPAAYNVTNDQVAYGRLGATWLFKKLGGKGNVVEMRGIAGVPADTDRHTGFQQALKVSGDQSRQATSRGGRSRRVEQCSNPNSGVQVRPAASDDYTS